MTSQQEWLSGMRACLVTTGQPATNPRLVKEADALSDVGADVHVIACKFRAWADDADAVYASRDWTMHWLRFGEQAPRWKDLWQRARRKGARIFARYVGPRPGLAERSLHYAAPEMNRMALNVPADLYIAHNLSALPPAYHAAQRHDGALGFDAEDFHRGEQPRTFEDPFVRSLTEQVEERYIPQCDYVTAASRGIGEAYADALGIEQPTTILNVFPWSEREQDVSEEALSNEVPAGKKSLYWFSQSIGPNRGLEEALQALPHLPSDIILILRGEWRPGYEETFRSQAQALDVNDRVRHLDLVPPDELIPRTSQHDVGLALEQPISRNREICLTNKLFTYLLAGVPFVASLTSGQRPIVEDLPRAARGYEPGDVRGLFKAVSGLLQDEQASNAALQAAQDQYCWNVEKNTFLEIVRQTLKQE